MYPYESLISPVSDAEPCGPDLDLAGDVDFMNFTAFADSVLPASYFRFDRSEVDLAGQVTAMKSLLQRTRDVRLLVMLAKYLILDRQFEPFVNAIAAIGTLIKERWQDVHPRGEDGDFALRIATLESLDDMAQVILPLQHQALFRSRKTGSVSLRTHLIASGKLARRENEESFDAGTLEQAIAEADIREVIKSRDQAARLKAAFSAIQIGTREGMDFQGSVSLERLVPLVDDMYNFLEGIVVRREPTAAAESGTPAGAEGTDSAPSGGSVLVAVAPTGALRHLKDVESALGALGRYYALKEPSSPSLLLVRQAQSLIGKNFYDGIRALLPSHASEAMLTMGAKPGFDLAIERLADVASEYATEEQSKETPAEETEDSWSSNSEEADWDRSSDDQESEAGETSENADGETSDGDTQGTDDSHVNDESTPPKPAPARAEPSGPRSFLIHHRAEAFALISAVQEYYHRVEPASPIPLLLERARNVGTMDFFALMRLVMPSRAFRPEDQ